MKTWILLLIGMAMIPASAFADPLKLGVYPSNDPRKLIVPMTLMADYLTEKTGDRFIAVVTQDYAELSERLKSRSVQIAWINPINYIKMKSENPSLKYIATYLEKNQQGQITPYYHSFIITLKTSGITHIDQAENHIFAFTDPGSTSGFAFPNLMLRDKGIVPDEFFRKVFFLKKHDRVIEALVNHAIDIGAVSDGTYYTAVKTYGDIFSIIDTSEPIPLDAIVAPDNTPKEKIIQYQKVLTAMPESHPFNLSMREHLGWNAAGFEVKNDRFYDPMRRTLQ